MKLTLTTAIAASFWLIGSTTGLAASFSDLNSSVIKFNAGASEAELKALGVASISFGNTNIYIGTNQVSGINQDPIVTSFTNGVRNWVQSYDTSGIDARGVGLLWDEGSSNLYGVFTADGGSSGFSAATKAGWLPSYGSGGGSKVSVLLKLNPDSGSAEAGTYIRAQLSNGKSNTVVPTGLDYINDQVVFFGESFFTPLDVDGQKFETRTEGVSSPFPYRVVFTPDLTTALSAESIGWDGVTAFSPLEAVDEEEDAGDETNDDGAAETGGDQDDDTVASDDPVDESDGGDDSSAEEDADVPDETPTDETPADEVDDETSGDADGGVADDIDSDVDAASVPEPGFVLGLSTLVAGALWQRRGQRSPTQSIR